MFHKQHNAFQTSCVSNMNLDTHPIIPVLDDSIVNDSSDFLDNIKNNDGAVEFFNSFYTQDWFSSKYCPVRRRNFVIQKFTDSHSHFTEQGRSSYIDLYFKRLMLQNRIPHNVLGSFVCLPTIPLSKTRSELENYVHSLNLPGFEYLVLSEPLQKIKMRRLGWFIFDSIENAKNAIDNCSKIETGDEFVPHFLPAKESNRNVKMVDDSFDAELRKRFDLLVAAKVYYTISIELCGNGKEDVVKLVSFFLMNLKKETKKLQGNRDSDSDNDYSLVDTLSFFVDTLRDFYSFCYYCGRFFLSKDEMFARCGRVHIRNNYTNRWRDILESIKTQQDPSDISHNNNTYNDDNINSNNDNDNDNNVDNVEEKEEGLIDDNDDNNNDNETGGESYTQFKERRAGLFNDNNNDNNSSNNNSNNFYFINTPETFDYRLPEDKLYLTKEEEALILDPDRLLETNFFDLAILAKQSEKQEDGEIQEEPTNNYSDGVGKNINEDIKQLISKTDRQNILNTKLRSHFEAVNEKAAKEPNWQSLADKLKTDDNQSIETINRKVILSKLLFHRKRYGLIRFYKEFKEVWAVDNLKKCVIEESDKCFVCCFCSKRFGGKNFIHKHVLNKHGDVIEDMLRELYFREYFLNYYRDDMKLGESDFVNQMKHFHK